MNLSLSSSFRELVDSSHDIIKFIVVIQVRHRYSSSKSYYSIKYIRKKRKDKGVWFKTNTLEYLGPLFKDVHQFEDLPINKYNNRHIYAICIDDSRVFALYDKTENLDPTSGEYILHKKLLRSAVMRHLQGINKLKDHKNLNFSTSYELNEYVDTPF